MDSTLTTVYNNDCQEYLTSSLYPQFDMTFLDPPFNQNKDYAHFNDNLPEEEYWAMMTSICSKIYSRTVKGGAMYFMQREKNVAQVIASLTASNWTIQNLIIWKKKTSAVPGMYRYGKQYQVIVFATKGARPKVFNRMRISPPLPAHYKYERENGIFVTDIWDDIRELTSGYFAGDEAIRKTDGERIHKQQSPIALLLRMILSSTKIGDTVFDPFAGTGTTLITAQQIGRKAVGIEIDPLNVKHINKRVSTLREADDITRFLSDYRYTENINEIIGFDYIEKEIKATATKKQSTLFSS